MSVDVDDTAPATIERVAQQLHGAIEEIHRLRSSHAKLLAAAKEVLSAYNFGISSPYKLHDAVVHLKIAIAAAEDPAP
jgi:hypothetical protein